jgi:hypothetical protein
MSTYSLEMFTNDERMKILMIRQVIYNVNLQCQPRPARPIPHFTDKTRVLLSQLREKKPQSFHIFNR